jgi:hypothetical protein
MVTWEKLNEVAVANYNKDFASCDHDERLAVVVEASKE